MRAGTRRAALAAALAAAFVMSGCSSDSSGLTKLSPVERQFVAAAPTWDLDHDGVVTCDEWRRYTADLFAVADADKKGYLAAPEFAALVAQDRLFETANFAYYDTNKDGRVTRDEFVERPNPAFQYLDKRNDCALNANDLLRAYNPAAAGERTRTADGSQRKR